MYLNNFVNFEIAMNKLKKQYGTTDFATIDLSHQEICRINMDDKEEFEHLKQHNNKVLGADQVIPQ